MKQKIFSISWRKFSGKVGGGGGVNYKLLLANQKHKVFEQFICIFKDCIIDNPKDEICFTAPKNTPKLTSKLKSNGFAMSIIYIYRIIYLYLRLKKLSRQLAWSQNDRFILHDIESAVVFCHLFPSYKSVLVYHNQGPLYKEWSDGAKSSSQLLKYFLHKLTLRALSSVPAIAFPSEGAKNDFFVNHKLKISDLSEQKEILVFYNGYDTPEHLPPPIDKNTIEALGINKSPIFISVANLVDAKGIDQLPPIFEGIKNSGCDFKWVIVGDGPQASLIERLIKSCGISDNTMWIRNKIPHSDIENLFSKADYYIMAHRISIFDFATIEAMAHGCIPILSPVGGNIDIIKNDNGLYLSNDSISSSASLVQYLKSTRLDLPTLNQEIHRKRFSELAFLNYYAEWALKRQ